MVEIEPLKVAPLGSMIGSRTPDDERVNVEVVAAEAQKAVNEIISSVINAVYDSVLVFFIFPLGDV